MEIKMTAHSYCLALLNSSQIPFMPTIKSTVALSQYYPEKKMIGLNWKVIDSTERLHIAEAVHEAVHAIDHYEWPWLFTVRWQTRYIVLGYFINLFLEWHASHIAYRFLKDVGAFDAPQLKRIKKYYRQSLKTYL
jgi:hypothetical protein